MSRDKKDVLINAFLFFVFFVKDLMHKVLNKGSLVAAVLVVSDFFLYFQTSAYLLRTQRCVIYGYELV